MRRLTVLSLPLQLVFPGFRDFQLQRRCIIVTVTSKAITFNYETLQQNLFKKFREITIKYSKKHFLGLLVIKFTDFTEMYGCKTFKSL